MHKLSLLFVTCLLAISLPAQISMNMTLLDQWDDLSLPTHSGLEYNDCWGYTAPDGREYAILGSAGKIHFIDITDPTNVVEVANFGNLNANGASTLSIWRDFKTYGNYAYAVADQNNEGLIVFDLSGLPTTVTKVHQSTASFNQAHNVFIDEPKARMYIPGSNTHGQGIIVFDLTNPALPVEIGAPNMTGGYSHDIYVRNDTAYCFHGNNPSAMYVYDFADPMAPVELGSLTSYTNSGYNHSGWLTKDSKHLIFCDETAGTRVKVADVEDLTDITAPASAHFFANLDNQSPLDNIAHNPFVKGDYVYVAYYREGIQVWDISDPMNAVLEGYYDTNPNPNAGRFDGLWGVFPFFNSGTVIGSDTETGLYVFNVTTILPVDLIEFSAIKNGKKAELNWKTAFERNNEAFEIQRSTDKESFETIGTVAGQGNSEREIAYQYFDESPSAGVNYYRLKQLDTDGKFEYSEVKSVEFAPQIEVNIFPTLVKRSESITLSFEGVSSSDFTFLLTDIAGKVIEEGTISRLAQNYSFDTSNLQSGVYLIDVKNNRESFSQRIVVE